MVLICVPMVLLGGCYVIAMVLLGGCKVVARCCYVVAMVLLGVANCLLWFC